jgi:NADH:ubiquinone oxidoreductase subunit C
MNTPLMLDFVTETMKEFGNAEPAGRGRIRIATTPGRIRKAVSACLSKLNCDRLITISSADTSTALELIYHLTGPHRTVLSLSIGVPKELPEAPTLSDLLPPAGILERQIHDLFGIVFTGHPGLKRIILNEEWPENEFPLRKDWKPAPDTFYGGIKEDWM